VVGTYATISGPAEILTGR